MDELERIAAIAARLGRPFDGVRLGIGDDAAVLAGSDGDTVLSVDAAVEGVHFRWDFADARALGERAAVTALSDLAAMGARPRAMLCSLQLPPGLDDTRLLAFVDGIGDAGRSHGAPVVGGNLSGGPGFAAHTTVVGSVSGAPLTRGGARPGDRVFVSGPVGGAALGLQFLLRGDSESAPSLIERWRAPSARIALGQDLRGRATAAIDVSDGLLQDLGHLCDASGVGATLQASAIPLEAEATALAAAQGLDALSLALGGGEDFELVFTGPEDLSPPGVEIGRITADREIRVVDDAGRALPLPDPGYRHFDR